MCPVFQRQIRLLFSNLLGFSNLILFSPLPFPLIWRRAQFQYLVEDWQSRYSIISFSGCFSPNQVWFVIERIITNLFSTLQFLRLCSFTYIVSICCFHLMLKTDFRNPFQDRGKCLSQWGDQPYGSEFASMWKVSRTRCPLFSGSVGIWIC